MLSRVASWHHGSAVWPILTPMRWRSASRPSSVILGKLRSIVLADICLFLCPKHLAVDLAGRRLGQLGYEFDEARILVLAEALAHEVLDLLSERLVARAVGDDEGLHDLAAQRIGHADRADLAHVGMLQNGVLDLDRAHRPAGRDDDVVGAAAVEEVAVLVGAAEILGCDPAA